ncbi:MAG: M14 family zinc carboxypeptidase [Phycisphaerales bacterium]
MRHSSVVGVVIAACTAAASAQMGPTPAPPGGVRYDGHKVVQVDVRTARELTTTLALTDDVWSHRVGIGGQVDVRVSPEQLAAMQQAGLRFTVMIEDVQAQIDAEAARLAARAHWAPGDGPGFFDDFHTYDEHRAFLQDLVNQYPNLASMIVVGQSLEGRDIFGIRITGPGSTANRPAAFYNAAQHAREWATPPVIAYIAEQLLTNYATDCRIQQLVDSVEFHLVPFVNPDGYVYTWTPNNRLWRKNRKPPPAGSTCFGVDTNRNWGYQWGGQGASTDPCSETYRGVAGFSEPETQAVRDYVSANPRFRSAMDFHSYSQLVMSPWAYTDALPPDHPTFAMLNTRMQQAIESTYGLVYAAGPIFTTIYPASGGAVDWFYGAEGVYAFTIEVRPTGNPGFLLPPDQILPNAIENYNAILELAGFTGDALLFELPSGPPATVPPNTPTPVQVAISSGSGAYYTGSGRLHSRIGGAGPFTLSPLTPLGGTVFQGTLPAAPCGSVIEYFFSADTTTFQTVVFPACADPLQTSAVSATVAFTDEFETAVAGWTIQNDASLTAGGWVRADPVGTTNAGAAAQPEDDHTAAPGVACYVTANGAVGGAAGSADVDGGPTRLLSPTLDLAGADGAVVNYWYWLYSVNGTPDPMEIHVSNNNGSTWTAVTTHASQSSWRTNSFAVQDFVTLTDQVRVRFTANDTPNNSLTEAAIDDFVVSTQGCPATCYADCNTSGSLTVADFGCFQGKYVLGDLYADCNASGTLTVADFGCFQGKYVLGCP